VVAIGPDAGSVAAARQELGDQACVLQGDATQPDTAPAAIAELVRRTGRLDGVYHVAGGSGRRFGDGPLHELSDDGWRATLQLNLDSVFYSNRAAVRQFLTQGTGGSVLNLGSVLAWSPSSPRFVTHAYASAKAALVGLTRSCAAHYAPHNIRFNLLAPGLVDTPMAQRAAQDPAIRTYIQTKQPLDGGRIGHPTDLDAAVVFFLSRGSAFVTGQVLAIDGGWEVCEARDSASS
jgi:NAD(P)-dependent dehydrogenase (short-subunit alcohol dehydrogenase family)